MEQEEIGIPNRRKYEKKYITFFFLVLFSLLFLYADKPSQEISDEDFHTNSGGSGNSQLGKAFWKEPMSGYRFSIVDSNFEAVKNGSSYSIDILFSEARGNLEKYSNSRAATKNLFQLDLKQEINDEYVWKSVVANMKLPPKFSTNPPHPMEVKKVGRLTDFLNFLSDYIVREI